MAKRKAPMPFEVADPSSLTDADWAELNKLKDAWAKGGKRGLSKAMANLNADPVRYIRVMGAVFPDMVRETIKDEMAEAGMTEDDLRELIQKLEGSTRSQ